MAFRARKGSKGGFPLVLKGPFLKKALLKPGVGRIIKMIRLTSLHPGEIAINDNFARGTPMIRTLLVDLVSFSYQKIFEKIFW